MDSVHSVLLLSSKAEVKRHRNGHQCKTVVQLNLGKYSLLVIFFDFLELVQRTRRIRVALSFVMGVEEHDDGARFLLRVLNDGDL